MFADLDFGLRSAAQHNQDHHLWRNSLQVVLILVQQQQVSFIQHERAEGFAQQSCLDKSSL